MANTKFRNNAGLYYFSQCLNLSRIQNRWRILYYDIFHAFVFHSESLQSISYSERTLLHVLAVADAGARPLQCVPILLIFTCKFAEKSPHRRLATLQTGLAPPSTRNPGSTTDSYLIRQIFE